MRSWFCSTSVYCQILPAKLMAMQFQSAGKSTVWSYQKNPDLSQTHCVEHVHTKFVHLLIIGAVGVQNGLGPNLADKTWYGLKWIKKKTTQG